MKVQYIHTFTVTVEGSDNFATGVSLEKLEAEGERDASYVTMFMRRGSEDPVPVRSQVITQTIVKF